jgi:dTDP-glucose 4,6-dehydratase
MPSIAIDMTPNILVTGGTGFFGKALLRYWSDMANYGQHVPNVTLLSRHPDRFASHHPMLSTLSSVSVIKGDVCDFGTLPLNIPFTHIVHAAAQSAAYGILPPQVHFDQIVNGTRNVLNLAVACGARRCLLISSGGVYGNQASDMKEIPENCHTMPDPLDPANAYSIGKRMAEHLGALYGQAHHLSVIVARCFSFVGPDLPLNEHFAIGNFIRDALQADAITVQSDGSALRSYMDQRDLAHWLVTLLLKGQAGHAYNVGSDQAISILELAHTVRSLISPTKPVNVLGTRDPKTPRHRYIPSITKARDKFGLNVTISLEDAIRFAANVHLRDGPPL